MTTDIFNRLNELAEFKLEVKQERIKRGLQECTRKAKAARAYMVHKTPVPASSSSITAVPVPQEGIVK